VQKLEKIDSIKINKRAGCRTAAPAIGELEQEFDKGMLNRVVEKLTLQCIEHM